MKTALVLSILSFFFVLVLQSQELQAQRWINSMRGRELVLDCKCRVEDLVGLYLETTDSPDYVPQMTCPSPFNCTMSNSTESIWYVSSEALKNKKGVVDITCTTDLFKKTFDLNNCESDARHVQWEFDGATDCHGLTIDFSN